MQEESGKQNKAEQKTAEGNNDFVPPLQLGRFSEKKEQPSEQQQDSEQNLEKENTAENSLPESQKPLADNHVSQHNSSHQLQEQQAEKAASDAPKETMHTLLEAKHLSRSFGRKLVVKDVSLSMYQGEVVGLLGPNGAGKTTCFYMIAGFIRPTKGHVYLDKRRLTRFPMYKRARYGVSYLPQDASVFRTLTVEQNIAAVLEYQRDYRSLRKRRNRVNEILEELGIAHLRKQLAVTLSGGERRRTEIGRALAVNPLFLLLDEPFAGIDPIAVHDLKELIRQLANKGIGILITDHNVRDTLEITDRAYIISLGEVLISGSHDELINNEEARKIYLGKNFRM